jgi:flagellar basal-body rod protein FlgC
MANAETTQTPAGGAYRRQHVIFAANPGDPEFASSLNAAAGDGAFAASGSGVLATSGTGTLAAGGFAALPAPLPPFNLNSANQAAPGVHIAGVVQDTSPPLKRYDPANPEAGTDGYVSYPDINPLTEMVDLMGATRAYGLNSSAVQAEKGMISSALEIAKS